MIKTAILAAKKAGNYLAKNYYKLHAKDIHKKKGFYGLSTKADLGAEKIVKNILKKKFPAHNILGEESGLTRKKSDYTWIIDPLDGTHNYVMKNPLFCTSIGLAYKNEVILGVVYASLLKELFWAESGKGAFLNNKKIQVSKKSKIENSLILYCHGHQKRDIQRLLKIYSKLKFKAVDTRQLGAGGIETTWVAAGRAEAFVIPGGEPWDVAPGIIIVREAGGEVTDFKNKEWNLKTKDMLCSNGKIHKNLLRTIK